MLICQHKAPPKQITITITFSVLTNEHKLINLFPTFKQQRPLPRKRNLQKVQEGSPLTKNNTFGARCTQIFQFTQKDHYFRRFHPILLNIDLEATIGWSCDKILLVNGLPDYINKQMLSHYPREYVYHTKNHKDELQYGHY